MTADGGRASSEPVAAVGLGAIGLSWAVLFAAGGLEVRAFDLDIGVRGRARDGAAARLRQLEEAGAIPSAEQALDRLQVTDDLATAVRGAAYVQESVVEDRETKAAVFADLGRLTAREAVLASSTSEIPGGAFMADIIGPERALVVHPINPPHLIPLVEICATPLTSAETVDRARTMMLRLGRAPVVLQRELPGFLANRLQMALVGEAMRLVGEGYCSAIDADIAVREGLAPRWTLVGPFEAGHLNAAGGVRDYFTKFRSVIRRLMGMVRPDYEYDGPLLDRIHAEIEAQRPGESVATRQAERDRRLIALRRHLSAPAGAQP